MTGAHHARRAIQHGAEVVAVPQLGLAGRHPHPDRQLQPPLGGDRGVDGRFRRRERRDHSVTGVTEQKSAVRLDLGAQHLVVRGEGRRIASASASHRRVEPSMSVNRNVTTPEGGHPADTRTDVTRPPVARR